jgi:hypothetical protein
MADVPNHEPAQTVGIVQRKKPQGRAIRRASYSGRAYHGPSDSPVAMQGIFGVPFYFFLGFRLPEWKAELFANGLGSCRRHRSNSEIEEKENG